ncbi:MAG: hypothetical protein JSV80_15740 [Acidobacteriota bacterium]|nr:MAG: hypothetical protein JSV80_15740 [Acidobacteriota bacterium]
MQRRSRAALRLVALIAASILFAADHGADGAALASEHQLLKAHLLAWKTGDVERLRTALPPDELLGSAVAGENCSLLESAAELKRSLTNAAKKLRKNRRKFRRVRVEQLTLDPEMSRVVMSHTAGDEDRGCRFRQSVTIKQHTYEARIVWDNGSQSARASGATIRIGDQGRWYIWTTE